MWHKNLYLRPIPKRGHILKDKVDQEQMGGVEVIFLGENSPDSKAWIVGSTCLSFTAWVTEHHLLVPINCHPPSVRRASVSQWETKTTALGGEMGQGPSCRLWPPSAAGCGCRLPVLFSSPLLECAPRKHTAAPVPAFRVGRDHRQVALPAPAFSSQERNWPSLSLSRKSPVTKPLWHLSVSPACLLIRPSFQKLPIPTLFLHRTGFSFWTYKSNCTHQPLPFCTWNLSRILPHANLVYSLGHWPGYGVWTILCFFSRKIGTSTPQNNAVQTELSSLPCFHSLIFPLFYPKVLLCSSNQPIIWSIDQDGLRFREVYLPQLLECWSEGYAPPSSASFLFFK